jgi:hypothetical protein
MAGLEIPHAKGGVQPGGESEGEAQQLVPGARGTGRKIQNIEAAAKGGDDKNVLPFRRGTT